MKTIAYTLTARRALRNLPTSTRRQIEAKLARDWRVIFVETDTTIEVRAVGHRRDIYR